MFNLIIKCRVFVCVFYVPAENHIEFFKRQLAHGSGAQWEAQERNVGSKVWRAYEGVSNK